MNVQFYIRTQYDDCCDIVYPICISCDDSVQLITSNTSNVYLSNTASSSGYLDSAE